MGAQSSGFLTQEDFVSGLVAMAPMTAHDGLWLIERSKLVFRYYDRNASNMLELDELAELLQEMFLTNGF